MSKPVVFLFSGQGSQYYQMGKELFDQNSIFRNWMITLDDLVFENTGESVLSVLYDEKMRRNEPFDRLLYTHPAIFMVQFALAQVLLECGIKPDFVLGTSLGEFASAALAGILGVEEQLKTVLKQADCLEKHCARGGMLAIIHGANLYDEIPLIRENSELASLNYDLHFVVSGSSHGLKLIERFLRSENILCQPLPVSYGFHSSLIDAAAPPFLTHLSGNSYAPPRFSFVSGVSGDILTTVHENYFWDVIRKPIKIPAAVRAVEQSHGNIYLDLGPGGTLANFVKRNLAEGSRSECYSLLSPFNRGVNILEQVKELCGDHVAI